MAAAFPQANRQPQDEPPRGLCADGPALPADQSRERRPESWRQSLGGDAESGAGGEFDSSFLHPRGSFRKLFLASAVLLLMFMVLVSLLPLRDHKRCPGGFGDGCHGACRLERDSGCDFSDQDEGSQGLKDMSEKRDCEPG